MRALYIAWQDPDDRRWRPVGRLTYEDGVYRFVYTKGANTKKFTPFGSMQFLDAVYESKELFPLFSNRLIAKNRPEYRDYLGWLNITDNDDPFVELARTGGMRGTDSLAIFPCPEESEEKYHIHFFSHGLRHLHPATQPSVLALVNQLPPGTKLYLMLDVQNSIDPLAIAIRTEPPVIVGYVPSYFTEDIKYLLTHVKSDEVGVQVERVNSEAPIQLRLLCNITAAWPKGFIPCSGPLYEAAVETAEVKTAS